MNPQEKHCLRIAVTRPVHETYDYRIPDSLAGKAQVGCRVLVPFRNKEVVGYILEKRALTGDRELKPVLMVMDPFPLFHETMVPFFEWMADYYLFPLGRTIQSALPGGLNPVHFKTARLTEKGVRAMGLLPPGSGERVALEWVCGHPGKGIPSRHRHILQKRDWLIVEEKRRVKRTGPLTQRFVRPKAGKDLETILADHEKALRAKNEHAFLRAIFEETGISRKVLGSMFSNGSYLVRKWIERGVIEDYPVQVVRSPAGNLISPMPVPQSLFEQQRGALAQIRERLDRGRFSTCLLHGVTGSGKTEVYYRAIQHTLAQGRQAIMMVPEIALAVYMQGLFMSRMGGRVAVYHSGLSEGERYDQWMRMAKGEVDLVIGARSALFAPFGRLGLIIVDEEHDFSYKQEEAPRYHARDAAVVRGKLDNAVVLLGSGTPSIQSFHNSREGRYQGVPMPDRVEKRPLPEIQVIDMKTVSDGKTGNDIISPRLFEAMDATLHKGEQIILFLNRRGFHRVFLCRHCGESVRCRNCDVALIHHLEENRLSCHYCGFSLPPAKQCPHCGRIGVRAYGFGTERLETELKQRYPDARIARMDRDTTRRKGHTFQLLKRFSRHEVDILLGTQMITKGYDFPNVTLVGVIAADFSLGFPDFRAGERTFQTLSQVAGRTGRGDQGGQVVVQTFNPEHYAIKTAKDHDYLTLFQKEKALRQQLGYPPFSYLACLRFQGNQKENTAAMATRIGEAMNGLLGQWPKRGKEIQILGPVEAPLSKIRGKHRWQILVKSGRSALLHHFLREVDGFASTLLRASGVTMIIDVDPYQML